MEPRTVTQQTQQPQLAPAMIDLIQYGEMRASLMHVQAEIAAIRAQSAIDIAEVRRQNELQSQTLKEVLATMNEAKGGWKMMMLLGGAAGTTGAALAAFVMNMLGGKPPPVN